jgi:alanyl-tRNA synthetase
MVVKDDPTLMFNNAGMNQFKDVFLGNRESIAPRVTDTQKCLRVSGKHNDLEEVGVDTYHHTMFEMLGNWSFGDYFKQESIDWAWEFLTEELKLDKDRLYATIFEGDKDDNLGLDIEAQILWQKHLPDNRVIPANKNDNFWEMGEIGPCGPCSEIHIDLRKDDERAKIDGRTLVNSDHPQVIEIWNLVFMEFNRKANGSLEALPAKHVDTGMGFERLCMAVQGKHSNYDTDLFAPLISKVESFSGKKYQSSDSETDIAIRVIVDHIRAIAFCIADGQLPGNSGAGYVIKRILRRAVRYGYSFLELDKPFLNELVDVLALEMGSTFPEIPKQKDLITKVIREEELSFLRTLGKGIDRFTDHVQKNSESIVSGEFAFELYDTFGFPLDLTQLLAKERDLEVNLEVFNNKLEEQRNRSRQATTTDSSDWVELIEDEIEEFIGYGRTEADLKITRYRKVSAKGKEFYQLVFNITPFYAESGGQVGDTGTISNENESIIIFNTKKENQLTVHFSEELPNDPSAPFKAQVDAENRLQTTSNHSATHLLHAVLREKLGSHVEQKGSLVNPEYLRFDFSHFSKVTDEEIAEVESEVNRRIRENIELNEQRDIPIDEAKNLGAMALFGEKYGDLVRVITFNPEFSVELCGGTHVNATGQIGLFKITSEGSVAAGIRRIEAISGQAALDRVNAAEAQVKVLKELLKAKDPVKGVKQLMSSVKDLKQQMESANAKTASGLKDELVAGATDKGGYKLIVKKIELTDSAAIKNLAFSLMKEADLVALLGVESNGKPALHLSIGENLTKEKGWNAGTMIRTLAQHIKGGGGGQPGYASAGGVDSTGLDAALQSIDELLS